MNYLTMDEYFKVLKMLGFDVFPNYIPSNFCMHLPKLLNFKILESKTDFLSHIFFMNPDLYWKNRVQGVFNKNIGSGYLRDTFLLLL